MFRKLYRDVFETYTELPEMVSTLSGMKNTVYEINSKKGLRKEKVSELEITATETSQNTKGKKATLAFLLSQAHARHDLVLAHLHLLLPRPTITHHKNSPLIFFGSLLKSLLISDTLLDHLIKRPPSLFCFVFPQHLTNVLVYCLSPSI